MLNFNKKATTFYVKAQSAVGTPAVPIGTDAIAITAADYKDNIATQTEEYAGDELARDEFTYLTDWYADATGNIFLPARGNVILATIADFKLAPTFQACGMNAALTGTTLSDQVITLTNSIATTTYATVQSRFSTPDDAVNDYLLSLTDARGMMDLEWAVGSKAKMKTSFKGNYNDPTKVTKLTPNFGTQKALAIASPLWKSATTVIAEITGSLGGGKSTHTGLAGTVKNVCFSKINFTNISGFDLTRELNSCNELFSKTAKAGDVTLTVKLDDPVSLANESSLLWNPYKHVGDKIQFTLKVGAAQGGYVAINCTSLTMVDISFTTQGETRYLDLKFRNTGTTDIILS